MNTAALYKEDNLDLVHDCQQIFKTMMMAISVDGLGIEEPAAWKTSREDYPMGIDIFLVSYTGEIIGIPRSLTIDQTNSQKKGDL